MELIKGKKGASPGIERETETKMEVFAFYGQVDVKEE